MVYKNGLYSKNFSYLKDRKKQRELINEIKKEHYKMVKRIWRNEHKEKLKKYQKEYQKRYKRKLNVISITPLTP